MAAAQPTTHLPAVPTVMVARRPRAAWLPSALVLLVQVGLAFALFAPAWAHPGGVLVGNQIDSGPHTWELNWTPFALSHGHNPLVSDWIGAPHGVNLAWSTPVALPGLLLWPVIALAGPVVAFNLLITLGPALTAFAGHVVLRRMVDSRLAAAAGGTLLGFSPYVLAHAAAGHSNLVSVATVPLLLLLLDEVVVRQRRSPLRLGVLLGALAAAQAYLAEEVLATEAVAAVAGLAVLWVVAGPQLRAVMARRSLRRLVQTVAVAAPVFLLVAGPLLWTQFLGPQHISGSIQPRGRYVVDLANLLVPTRLQAVAPAAATNLSDAFTGNLGEWTGYIGLPLLAFGAAITWWQRRRLAVRWAAGMAVVMTLLALGPKLHVAGHETPLSLPWRLLGHLPLLDNVLTARMTVYVFLAFAVLLACGVDALLRERRRALQAGGAALLALSAVALAPALPFPTRAAAAPAFFTSDAVRALPEGSVALVLPEVNQDAMLWQVLAGMRYRSVGGWFLGPDAQGHVQNGPVATPLSRAVADVEASGDILFLSPDDVARYRAELRADQVQTIVVTAAEPNAATVVQFFQRVTGTPPHDDGAGTLSWTGLRF
jgi:hypothetical protein